MSHPFVTQFCDRHGKTRVRFRRAGFSAYLPPQDAADKIKGEWFCRSESVKRMIAFAKNGGTYANIG